MVISASVSPVDVGWLAGIFDGEGSISLDRRGVWRRPCLSVSSTDLEILESIRELLGGSITIVRESRQRKPHWKQAYRWASNGSQKVLRILETIHPHLRCPKKRARAKHLIDNYRLVTTKNGFLDEDQIAAKQAFEKIFYEL